MVKGKLLEMFIDTALIGTVKLKEYYIFLILLKYTNFFSFKERSINILQINTNIDLYLLETPI